MLDYPFVPICVLRTVESFEVLCFTHVILVHAQLPDLRHFSYPGLLTVCNFVLHTNITALHFLYVHLYSFSIFLISRSYFVCLSTEHFLTCLLYHKIFSYDRRAYSAPVLSQSYRYTYLFLLSDVFTHIASYFIECRNNKQYS